MLNKQRIEWIDIAKLICIILVVFGHTGYIGSFQKFLSLIHIPAFFILSGFFFSNKETWKKHFERDIHKLLIPYLFFYIISIPTGVTAAIRHPELFPAYKHFSDLIWKPFIGMIFGCELFAKDFPILFTNLPLWFILSLFLIRCIFKLQLKICTNTISLILFNILVMLCYYCIKDTLLGNIWHLKSALLCFPYYTFGYIINQKYHIVSLLTKQHISGIIPSFCALFIIGLLLPFTGDIVSYANPTINCNIFLAFIIGISGALAIFIMSSLSPTNHHLLFLGEGTLVILGMHYPALALVKFILLIFGVSITNYSNMFLCIIETILTLIICYFFISFTNKYLPLFIGKRKNNYI